MNDEKSIISSFDSHTLAETPFAIDFATAKPLSTRGSTCDTFECTVQHRRLFIKRLKTPYRNNPMYRAAFSKEYELGITLNHPSLPHYIGYGDDYIVMDYIEGDTLSTLVTHRDSRLTDDKFVKKLLLDLTNVVEYLHHRNIVHCDIKPDNIIISPHHDRPVTLIDLDKAYSPWLDSTHGDTARYGCDHCADGAIDYKGIGMIAASLGLKHIADACNSGHATADRLKKLLTNSKRHIIVPAVIAGVIIACVVGASALRPKPAATHSDEPAGQATTISDTSQVVAVPADTVAAPPPVYPTEPTIDKAWISALIAEKSAEISEYRRKLWSTLDSDTITLRAKREAIYEYTDSTGLATTYIIFTATEHYSNLSELDVQKAVRTNPGWIKLEE